MNKFGLTEEQYNDFLEVHNKHQFGWESEERQEQHSLGNIEKIEWSKEEEVLKVYYKSTKHFSKTWYNYDTTTNTWW